MAPTDGQQASLDLWPREHDLPPRWDGLPVQWGDWSDTAAMFICPPPRRPERCAHCGTTAAALINTGRIFTDEASAPTAIGRARLNGGRHLVGFISAFRCPRCERDRVLDPTGQEWDLDDTDYTDDGSWDNDPK
uniref:Uncharacterized protein n=1 Tax=Mycobacterium sp. (strain KMS) TaxID=189918 RepID=A1UQG7_MYCSK